jgi:hypothetical protein
MAARPRIEPGGRLKLYVLLERPMKAFFEWLWQQILEWVGVLLLSLFLMCIFGNPNHPFESFWFPFILCAMAKLVGII